MKQYLPVVFKVNLFLVTLLIASSLKGATYYSICNGGNWTNTSCWSLSPGGPPAGTLPNPAFDIINIQTNMILDIHLTGGSAIGGTLNIAAGASLYTQNYDMTVKAGGTLNVSGDLDVRNMDWQNNSSVTINTGGTVEVWGSFNNSNNSDQVTCNGMLILHGSCYNGNGGYIGGSGTVIFSNQGCSGSGTWDVANTGVLPIELLTFSVMLDNNEQAEIYWSTATETNNDFFTIEKTQDAQYYDVVSIVDGAGTSTTVREYFAIDPFPFPGISYYRLKQTDFNGDHKYSDLVALDYDDSKGAVEVSIYPNPVISGNMNVELKGGDEEEILVVVNDLLGREYYSKVVIMNGGRYKLVVDPSQKLAPGLYMVVASSHKNKLYSQKIVVK